MDFHWPQSPVSMYVFVFAMLTLKNTERRSDKRRETKQRVRKRFPSRHNIDSFNTTRLRTYEEAAEIW